VVIIHLYRSFLLIYTRSHPLNPHPLPRHRTQIGPNFFYLPHVCRISRCFEWAISHLARPSRSPEDAEQGCAFALKFKMRCENFSKSFCDAMRMRKKSIYFCEAMRNFANSRKMWFFAKCEFSQGCGRVQYQNYLVLVVPKLVLVLPKIGTSSTKLIFFQTSFQKKIFA